MSAVCCAGEWQHPELDGETKYDLRNRFVMVTYDLDHAWPTFAYIIVAVASGKSAAMTVWYLKENRSAFDEGELNGN